MKKAILKAACLLYTPVFWIVLPLHLNAAGTAVGVYLWRMMLFYFWIMHLRDDFE